MSEKAGLKDQYKVSQLILFWIHSDSAKPKVLCITFSITTVIKSLKCTVMSNALLMSK